MTAAARKVLSSVAHFAHYFSFDGWGSHSEPSNPLPDKKSDYWIGEYKADYTMPTEAEIAALNAEADSFLKKCRPVSR